jgi:hypothetical protein
MNASSPLITKLGSNKNYKVTDPIQVKKRKDQNDFNRIVEQICPSNEQAIDHNIFASFEFDAEDLSQNELHKHENENLLDNFNALSLRNRVIYFTTDQNLKLISTYSDWYCDGTFNISPTIFKQVYTFHIIIRGTTLPMLYALLPNKKQTTYKKLFRLISKHLTKNPTSINCDFEIAAINALKLVFGCRICGCYFHLCQSFWRKIQADGLKKWFNSDVRSTFRITKALAFLPEEDVVSGFEYVKQTAPASTKSFITYIENNYIGKTKDGQRVSARFPISLWNLNGRVKAGLPRTNNNVESWHSRIKPDVSKNLTVEKVVEFFRLEQNNMETDLVLLFSGETLKQTKKKHLVREENLKKLINDYNVLNLDLFLKGIINLLDDKIKE